MSIKKKQQNSFQHKLALLISVSKEISILHLQLLMRDDLILLLFVLEEQDEIHAC